MAHVFTDGRGNTVVWHITYRHVSYISKLTILLCYTRFTQKWCFLTVQICFSCRMLSITNTLLFLLIQSYCTYVCNVYACIYGLETVVSVLFTNTRTRWAHNEREIFNTTRGYASCSIENFSFIVVHCAASKCVYL